MFDEREKTTPSTGSYSICQPERDDIAKSIAYHEGRYQRQPEDRIIPQKFLQYLREKANL